MSDCVSIGFLESFQTINSLELAKWDLLEEFIPHIGETPYTWLIALGKYLITYLLVNILVMSLGTNG